MTVPPPEVLWGTPKPDHPLVTVIRGDALARESEGYATRVNAMLTDHAACQAQAARGQPAYFLCEGLDIDGNVVAEALAPAAVTIEGKEIVMRPQGRGDVIVDQARRLRPFTSVFDFAAKGGMTPDELKAAYSSLTYTTAKTIVGRVNINTAPKEVLLCLPGLEDSGTAWCRAGRTRALTVAQLLRPRRFPSGQLLASVTARDIGAGHLFQ